jgi:hypothetical protein
MSYPLWFLRPERDVSGTIALIPGAISTSIKGGGVPGLRLKKPMSVILMAYKLRFWRLCGGKGKG